LVVHALFFDAIYLIAEDEARRQPRRRPPGRTRLEAKHARDEEREAANVVPTDVAQPEPVNAKDWRRSMRAGRARRAGRTPRSRAERAVPYQAGTGHGRRCHRGPHRVPLPEPYVARGVHRIDLPAGDRQNRPSVAGSMVDVAQARNWKALRVSGHDDFKSMVWLEASVRGVKALGYEPNPQDLKLLKREREARLVNRIERTQDTRSAAVAAPTEKGSARGGGGRKAVVAAIEAVLVAKKVPEHQCAAVMAAATEKLAQRLREGQAPNVKVYDKAAPSQRQAVVVAP